MDESQILLNVANDDIPDADGIRIAIKVGKINWMQYKRYTYTKDGNSCRTLSYRICGI